MAVIDAESFAQGIQGISLTWILLAGQCERVGHFAQLGQFYRLVTALEFVLKEPNIKISVVDN
jgi:hypothetical protein